MYYFIISLFLLTCPLSYSASHKVLSNTDSKTQNKKIQTAINKAQIQNEVTQVTQTKSIKTNQIKKDRSSSNKAKLTSKKNKAITTLQTLKATQLETQDKKSTQKLKNKTKTSKTRTLKTRTPSSNNRQIKTWTKTLNQKNKNLSENNFKKVLNTEICPQLEKLTLKDINASQAYFNEIIKFHGKITNYTGDHNYFYCLANFLNDPKHNLVSPVAKKLLSVQEQKYLLERLSVCYLENSQGNGDVIPIGLNLKTEEEYFLMDENEKKIYSNQLRRHYMKFENELN